MWYRGLTHKKIAQELNVSRSGITKTIKKIASGQFSPDFKSKQRSGRPAKISPRVSEIIHQSCVEDPHISSKEVVTKLQAEAETTLAPRTVRNHLQKKLGLTARRPAKKPRLSQKNIRDRLNFCDKYRDWTVDQWRKVMFSDESRIVQFHNAKLFVRRPPGERYNPKFTTSTVKNPTSVMIWGAIAAAGRGGLWIMPKGTTINADVYLGILKEKLLPFMSILSCKVFQQDGAPVHTAKKVKSWIGQQNIEILDWPGSSPDLNVIENCWQVLKLKVAKTNPTSYDDLIQKIKQVWVTEITPEYCQKLCDSMPRRIQAVIDNNGYSTKY